MPLNFNCIYKYMYAAYIKRMSAFLNQSPSNVLVVILATFDFCCASLRYKQMRWIETKRKSFRWSSTETLNSRFISMIFDDVAKQSKYAINSMASKWYSLNFNSKWTCSKRKIYCYLYRCEFMQTLIAICASAN